MVLLNIRKPALVASVATAIATLVGATLWVSAQTTPFATTATAKPAEIKPVAGMPSVPDPTNLYSETMATKLSAAVVNALPRVYVPNRGENTVSVIEPSTLKVINKFKVGVHPQHVVPSWDLRTLWVANNAEGRTDGSLTPIDPLTGKPGANIAVDDPYNMYFSPDGKYAIVVTEAFKRLDFRDPRTMKLSFSIQTPKCAGINHADFSIDGRFALFTCEFDGSLTKIDLVNRKVIDTIRLSQYFDRADALAIIDKAVNKPKYVPDPAKLGAEICTTPGMPQDIRASPDGKRFYVADMMADGIHIVDGESFKQVGFIATGIGAHGLYPSRDGKSLYIANRGSNVIRGKPNGKGSVSVMDFASEKIIKNWQIPGGGSPDMGNVSADGKHLWLSGRYDHVVYRFDTATGGVDKINVGREPHGLTVWPQPGRYSLGHTGNLR